MRAARLIVGAAVGVLALTASAGAASAAEPPADALTPRSLVTDLVGTVAQPVDKIGDAVVSAGGTTMTQEQVTQAILDWYETQPQL